MQKKKFLIVKFLLVAQTGDVVVRGGPAAALLLFCGHQLE